MRESQVFDTPDEHHVVRHQALRDAHAAVGMLAWKAARWLMSAAEANDATDDDLVECIYARDMLEGAGDVAAASGLTQAAAERHALADRLTSEVANPLYGATGQDVPTEKRNLRKSCLRCDVAFRSTGCANWVCTGCTSRRS